MLLFPFWFGMLTLLKQHKNDSMTITWMNTSKTFKQISWKHVHWSSTGSYGKFSSAEIQELSKLVIKGFEQKECLRGPNDKELFFDDFGECCKRVSVLGIQASYFKILCATAVKELPFFHQMTVGTFRFIFDKKPSIMFVFLEMVNCASRPLPMVKPEVDEVNIEMEYSSEAIYS
ncbi:uncharacterized protein LOC131648823 isoform X2 [Vicia villosa]|uniref:uncharacterized protein LOC131648823 isoform X2 n=2 Tax=Vicia villosa TaxID=3911 RepID=UPI00273BF331|nr:uncharacterized protein LOC131648823 isoform X2 [Vicia villosa]